MIATPPAKGYPGASRVDKLMSGLGIFLSTFAFAPALSEDAEYSAIGDYRIQYLWVPLYAFVGFRLFTSKIRPQLQSRHFPLIALLAFVLLSATWSIDPVVSLRRAVFLLATFAFAFFITTRLSIEEFLSISIIILVSIALVSLASALVTPSLAFDPEANGLRGVLVQKNLLGRLMASGIVLAILRAVISHSRGRNTFLVVGLFAIVLLLSESATALLVSVLLSAFIMCWYPAIRTRSSATSAVVLVLGGLLLVVLELSRGLLATVLLVTGKDSTFTNRTIIWHYLDAELASKPLLGFGYGGFWLGESGPNVRVWEGVGAKVAHAHNGFIEISLQLGLVGLIAVLVVLGIALTILFARLFRAPDAQTLALIILILFALMYSVDESNLLEFNSFYCILLAIGLLGFSARHTSSSTQEIEVGRFKSEEAVSA